MKVAPAKSQANNNDAYNIVQAPAKSQANNNDNASMQH
jgi:hypothetical protein